MINICSSYERPYGAAKGPSWASMLDQVKAGAGLKGP